MCVGHESLLVPDSIGESRASGGKLMDVLTRVTDSRQQGSHRLAPAGTDKTNLNTFP